MTLRILKHPAMIAASSVVGGAAGVVAGVLIYAWIFQLMVALLHAEDGWQQAGSGVGGVFLIVEVIATGAILGGITGLGFVRAWGRFREVTGWAWIILGTFMALVALYFGVETARGFGERFALSLNGAGFFWSLQLVGGGLLLLRSHQSKSQERYYKVSSETDSNREVSYGDF